MTGLARWKLLSGLALAVALAWGGSLTWAYFNGRSAGAAAEAARHAAALRAKQDEIAELGEEVARMAQAIEIERRARAALVQEVEDEARNDPDGARPGIGSRGMQRLERRWGAR